MQPVTWDCLSEMATQGQTFGNPCFWVSHCSPLLPRMHCSRGRGGEGSSNIWPADWIWAMKPGDLACGSGNDSVRRASLACRLDLASWVLHSAEGISPGHILQTPSAAYALPMAPCAVCSTCWLHYWDLLCMWYRGCYRLHTSCSASLDKLCMLTSGCCQSGPQTILPFIWPKRLDDFNTPVLWLLLA